MIPHFYDFSVVKFKLPSRERLVKRLGEYDALAEFAVLSFYDFETIARSVQDTYKFVCDKAREYDVKIKGTVSMENYHEALYKSFMINTYAMFAEFIENVREDIRILINPGFVFVDDNNISDYERLKRSLGAIGINPPIPKWLEQLEEYYRLVRNHVAHNGGDDEKCNKAFKRIDLNAMYSEYKVFEKLAPNPPISITMQDFYLFSASVKHIANIITITLKDRIIWQNIGKTHPDLIRKHQAGTDRRKLARDILIGYGYRYSKEDLDKITADIRSLW
jgi:hypothetical protein